MIASHLKFSRALVAAFAISLIGAFGVFLFVALSAHAEADGPALFSDGFESGEFDKWTSADEPWATPFHAASARSGNYKASVSNTDGEAYLTNEISTMGHKDIVLSYWYNITGGNKLEEDDHVYVEWWDDDAGEWVEVAHYTDMSTDGWTDASHNLPAGANSSSYFAFRFRADLGTASDEFRLDDVELTGIEVLGAIHAFKYRDMNADGYYNEEEGDVPIEGWEICLYGDDEFSDCQLTDENGWVWWMDLMPQDYYLEEEEQEGWFYTRTYYYEIDFGNEDSGYFYAYDEWGEDFLGDLEDFEEGFEFGFGNWTEDEFPPISRFDDPMRHKVIDTEILSLEIKSISQDFGSGVWRAETRVHQIAGEELTENYPSLDSFFDIFYRIECPAETEPIQTELIPMSLVSVDPITVAGSGNWSPRNPGVYCFEVRATDYAGNQERTGYAGPVAYVPVAQVAGETTGSTSQTSLTVNWTTEEPATSRVIYDTESHPELGSAPNYGYAFSTDEFDTDPKVTSHSVTISGLTPGTTYYYRTVSKASPESVGEEQSSTTNPSQPQSSGGNGNGYDSVTPFGEWDDPKNGSKVSGLVNLALKNVADDTLGIISSLFQYRQSGQNGAFSDIAIDSSASDGWSAVWDTTNIEDGDYDLRATISDNAGNLTNLDISVEVENDSPNTPQPQALGVETNFLYRIANDPRVYAVVNNFKRHVPNPESFIANNYEWNDVQVLEAGEEPSYSEAKLLRAIGDIKVYLVSIINSIRSRVWIETPEEFNNAGYSWEDVIDVPSIELDAYAAIAGASTGRVAVNSNVMSLRVRTLPSVEGGIIGYVSGGQEFTYLDIQGGWYLIKFPSGVQGWSFGEYLHEF